MEKKIMNLYRELVDISAGYMIYQERNNVELIKKKIPQIQEFVMWFMDDNRLNIEQDLYQKICENLIYILRDLLTALEQADRVLLHDAVTYGLMEYLELFVQEVERE